MSKRPYSAAVHFQRKPDPVVWNPTSADLPVVKSSTGWICIVTESQWNPTNWILSFLDSKSKEAYMPDTDTTTIVVTYTKQDGKWSAHCNLGDDVLHHLTDELPDLSKLAYKVMKWLKKRFK
jgi:hypothetical protein